MTKPTPLAGLRLVEIADAIGGAYAAKMWADAGADVIKVEPPGGDPLRRWKASAQLGQSPPLTEGEIGALFHYLNGHKQSLVADLTIATGREQLRTLCADADLLLIDLREAEAELLQWLQSLRDEHPGLNVLTLSNWGPGGPSSDRAANEFTLQAEVGATAYRGYADRLPVAVGGQIGEYLGGTSAAVAALAALTGGQGGQGGQRVDVSLFETMLLCMQPYQYIYSQLQTDVAVPRSVEIPSIEPAADGWVGVCTITDAQWKRFADMIGHPAMGRDPALANAYLRYQHIDTIVPKIEAWTRAHSVEDILTEASGRRIPAAPIGNGQRVLDMAQVIARGVYRRNPAGFSQPRPPYRLYDSAVRDPARAPELGDYAGWPERGERRVAGAPATASPDASAPLEGLRVEDFTTFWAGPFATAAFGALGADVIKIESIQRPDGMRFAAGITADERPLWELSFVTHGANTNKRGLTLDMQQPEGMAQVKRLIADADIVIENYAPRVMERFGLGWEAIHALNGQAIMVRMPAFGLDGPWRDRTGFAMTVEQTAGLAWLTGYSDRSPLVPRGCVDPIGGMNAVFATLAALRLRDRGHGGQLVEVALMEAGLAVAAEQVVEYTAYDTLLQRDANRMPQAVPQGVFAGRDEQLLALSVSRPAHWRALVATTDIAELADRALEDQAERRARQDEIEALLADYCQRFDTDELAARLARAGVPAARLRNVCELKDHPQLRDTGFFSRQHHPVAGDLDYPGPPFRFNDRYPPIRRPAPLLGEHNQQILRDVLGLSDAEIAELERKQVIGDRPLV